MHTPLTVRLKLRPAVRWIVGYQLLAVTEVILNLPGVQGCLLFVETVWIRINKEILVLVFVVGQVVLDSLARQHRVVVLRAVGLTQITLLAQLIDSSD